MIFWIDAQLSPQLATWLTERFGIEAHAVRDLGLREATDREIFEAARAAGAVVLTKDKDFMEMATRLGMPPQILWITCGNTSNKRMREILEQTLPDALKLLAADETLVEISDRGI
jgi:predicted nuclease of predicted toxin-antitoxin system